MERIEIKQIYREHQQTMTAEVVGTVEHFINMPQYRAVWNNLKCNAKNTGTTLVNKRRYFVKAVDGNRISLLSGAYSDFLVTLDAYQSEQLDQYCDDISCSSFEHPSMKLLGLQNLLLTSDNCFVLGKRSKSVYQAPGVFSLPAGGVMPEYYSAHNVDFPNVYIASQKQIYDELGIKVPSEKLSVASITRDSTLSPNVSIVFEAQLALTKRQVLEKFEGNATSKWEHEHIEFFAKSELFSSFEKGKLQNKILGASIGAILCKGRTEMGENWYRTAKMNFATAGYVIVDHK